MVSSIGVVKKLQYCVWICKGDLNKLHDGKRDPIQSFLFCIKASEIVGRQKFYSFNQLLWSLICSEI